MARKATEDREQQILEAAIRIFSEKGYSNTTTNEIAKEVGIAEGTIFRYFKSKKELIFKVIVSSAEVIVNGLITRRLKKIADENIEKDIKEVLTLMLIDRINLVEENKDLFKVVITEIQYNDYLKEAFVKRIITSVKGIAQEMIDERSLGYRFRNDIDLVIALRSLVGMVMMYMFQKELFPELITMEKEKQAAQMAEIFINGILKEEESEK